MPPKRKAAAARKSPATQRRRTAAAAAAPAEATTTRIELPSQEWRAIMYDMYTKREMYDMFLTVGDQSLFCHRLVLGMASKMWRAEFGRSGMAESKAKEVELADVSFVALKAIVESLPGLLTQGVLTFSTTIQAPYIYYSLLKMGHPFQAAGRLTQGVPGVLWDPSATLSGPP